MGQGRIAGAENAVRRKVNTDLLFQCLLDINLGDNPKSFFFQRLGGQFGPIIMPGPIMP